MKSLLLLGAIGALIFVPGAAAGLLAFKPGRVGIVTRFAALFGLGFAVAGGCAFVLAAADLYWLYTYLPLWLICTALLWWQAVLRVQFAAQWDAFKSELADNWGPLLIGTVVLLVLMLIRGYYLHSLPGPHYVYYLNGIEIARDHGIPSRVLEYTKGWPPATDKVFLDSFTGVLTLINNNPLIGPGVLLWLSFVGAAIGLWATAWELGLRWTAILLPLLILADRMMPGIPGIGITAGFDDYRAEDFGMAVAFCALALGITTIREGGLGPALVAGIVLAAASGTHLVPTVIVVLMLCAIVLAELLRRGQRRPWRQTMRDALAFAGVSAVLGLLVRLFAGGNFGLGGASNQASYDKVTSKLGLDPTLYLFNGRFKEPLHPVGHFYESPSGLIQQMVRLATGLNPSTGLAVAVLIAAVVIALLFLFFKPEFTALGFAGAGLLLAVCFMVLFFAYRYHILIDATFALRRTTPYGPIGTCLLALGLIETALQWAQSISWKQTGPLVSAALGVAAVAALCLWLMPHARVLQANKELDTGQVKFATWVRTKTPCGARFLLNERSEGAVTAMTGRYAIDEGMGAYLLPNRLDQVADLLETASQFYIHPWAYERFLREHHINYVVRSNLISLLGYGGPVRVGLDRKLNHTSFLKRVYSSEYFDIYHVTGSTVAPVNKLLTGPYIACRKTPATF